MRTPGRSPTQGTIARSDLEALDRADPLAGFRERFDLPPGVIYLDGNSLGALPRGADGRIRQVVREEWGKDLIASWNKRDWFRMPERVGEALAPLLGAETDEVIAGDSVSVNLFKLLAAFLEQAPTSRRIVLVEAGAFPTDLYIVQDQARLLGDGRFDVQYLEAGDWEAAFAEDGGQVAVATAGHVDFRTGRRLDMARITAAARSAGVPFVWDLSHGAGAMPLRLNEDGVVAAVGCGYKFLNGGPGAPAFLYVARELHDRLRSPLSGWMGHARPFAFEPDYAPAAGMRRFLAGTPPILSMAALLVGIATFDGVDLAELRRKSEALGDLFIRLADERLSEFGVEVASPRDAALRGSQVSFRFADGYAAVRALADRGVVGDFRDPDLMRFGLTPLYTRFVDVFDAVEHLADAIATGEIERPEYRERAPVT